MVHKFLHMKIGSGDIVTSKSGASINEELAQELYKPVIKRTKRRKIYARFKDDIWAADLFERGSLSSTYGGVKDLLCVIHFFTKYAWVKPFKGKKS